MDTSSVIGEQNARWGIPGVAQIVSGEGGLAKVQIATAHATADIYLHGAQVTSWQPAGFADVLFLSGQSRFAAGRAIRGGIPICFPWFRAKADDAKAPAHGFVRTKAWELASLTPTPEGIAVSLVTQSDDESRRWWPHAFRAEHRVTVGAALKLELIVTNTGDAPFRFEEALHTYHRVGGVRAVRVHGLDGVAYLDNRDGNRRKVQAGDVVMTDATDNAYVETQHALTLVDPVLHRRIVIEKQNSRTTIVWNPWQADAKAMADLGDDEWRQMACVEASNILDASVELAPAAEHAMTVQIRVEEDAG